MWYVYILECADGTLYTGSTTNVQRRFAQHQSGTGARYTRARGVRRIVREEQCASQSEALQREAAIKKLPRDAKLRLCLPGL